MTCMTRTLTGMAGMARTLGHMTRTLARMTRMARILVQLKHINILIKEHFFLSIFVGLFIPRVSHLTVPWSERRETLVGSGHVPL